jgi:C-terminal processing protease CtpA/Prc
VWREGKPNTVTVTLGSRADMPRDEDNDNDNDNDNYNNNGHHGTTRTRTYSYSMPKMPMIDMMGMGPRLGVETQDLDQDLGGYFNRPTGKGILVTHVLDDTPAKRAGLRSGDVIIEVGGKAVDDTGDLRDALRDRDSGPVSLTVLRKGSRQTVTATLEERHGSTSDGMERAWIMSRDGHVQGSPGISDRERQELQRQMDDLRRQLDDLRKQMHTRD